VTTANETNLFILDYILIIPSAPTPVMATQSLPAGAFVGGIVGGIAGIVVILALALWYSMRKRSGGYQRLGTPSTPADTLTSEVSRAFHPYLVEPFDPTTAFTPFAGFSGLGPRDAHPDSPLSPSFGPVVINPNPLRSNHPDPNETVLTHVTGNSAQPRFGKAALVALRNQGLQEPVLPQDSGARFGGNLEQEASSSRLHIDIPPTYTPD